MIRLLQPRRRPSRTASAGAGVLAWVFALAIALQALVLPSHIHLQPESSAPALSLLAEAQYDEHGSGKNAPVPVDSGHCLLCQQIASAGAAVLPASPAAPPMLAAQGTGPSAPVEARIETGLSHHWLSRGPPLQA